MQSYKKSIKEFLQLIEENNLLKSISFLEDFPDAPKVFTYSAYLASNKRISDAKPGVIDGYGSSFNSKETALLKCLAEALERLAQICWLNKNITISSFKELNKEAIDPCLFIENKKIRREKIGWIEGSNLLTNSPCYIPAQLTHINYQSAYPSEPILNDANTTGAAGGFDDETTILKAIYEAVERDSFMTHYLTKIPGKRIAIEKIDSKIVKLALKSAERYNYEVVLIDITSDLQIPTFLSIRIDKTGIGPCITMGMKSSFSQIAAIEGSIQESFAVNKWLRTEVITKYQQNKSMLTPKLITNLKERGMYWYPILMLKELDFLIKQTPKQLIIKPFKMTAREELMLLTKTLKSKKIDVYTVNLTLKIFEKVGYRVFKAILPQLQMLTLNQTTEVIKHARLKAISEYFGYKKYIVNPVPQPFL